MKFRAIMTDSMCIQRFNIAISMLDKLCKQCIVRISDNGLFFIAFEEGADHRPLAWCTIPKKQYFMEFRMVGVSEASNEIVLSVAPHMLLLTITNSIKPSCGPKSLKISLTKRRTPCLTCEVYTIEENPTRICLHDIPVEIIARSNWEDYVIPQLTQESPSIAIVLPDLDGLENMWEMVRKMSKNVIVMASAEGHLIFKIETDVSTISSNFKDLVVEYCEEDMNEGSTDAMKYARVRSVKFMQLKELCHGPLSKIVLHIYHKKLIMFVATYEDLVFNCITPAVKK